MAVTVMSPQSSSSNGGDTASLARTNNAMRQSGPVGRFPSVIPPTKPSNANATGISKLSKLKTILGGGAGKRSPNASQTSLQSNSAGAAGNLTNVNNVPDTVSLLSPQKSDDSASIYSDASGVFHSGVSGIMPYSNNIHEAPSSQATNGKISPASSVDNVPFCRFVVSPDGTTHEHHLKSTRRQEKLGSMLRELMGGGKKVRDDAVSAVASIVGDHSEQDLASDINQLSLLSGLVSDIQNGEKDPSNVVRHAANGSLLEKYGKCHEVVGKGAYGIVRLAHKYDRNTHREVLYAVKEFKRRSQETEKQFNKRLTSEFCISSSLRHPNIIHTLDLMKDAKGECCQVMEFCEGGDLYSLILASEGGLEPLEADCYFKQIMKGVVYMHSMGVAHCDLKPENILLTRNGVAKITDFGNGECFRMAWENEIHLSSGVCGSKPYIAPEQFKESEFDSRAVDIWATGVIYMAMRTGSYLWQVAIAEEDEYYRRYLNGRKDKNGYEPIENLKKRNCRNVIYSVLDPVPTRRITGKQVLNSEWGRTIVVCEEGERGY